METPNKSTAVATDDAGEFFADIEPHDNASRPILKRAGDVFKAIAKGIWVAIKAIAKGYWWIIKKTAIVLWRITLITLAITWVITKFSLKILWKFISSIRIRTFQGNPIKFSK